jgi:hypothetical protein
MSIAFCVLMISLPTVSLKVELHPERYFASVTITKDGCFCSGTDDTIMPMLSKGKTANARMWVYVGDDSYPYNVFDLKLNRGRDGPKYFTSEQQESSIHGRDDSERPCPAR